MGDEYKESSIVELLVGSNAAAIFVNLKTGCILLSHQLMKESDNLNGQSLHCSFETPFLLGTELKRECLVEHRVSSAVLRASLLLLHHATRRAQLQHAYIRSCRKRKGTRSVSGYYS